MDANGLHIGEVARLLGVTREHLRNLERQGIVPPVGRDFAGRVYSDEDLDLLRRLGVGQRPRRLRRLEEVLGPDRARVGS